MLWRQNRNYFESSVQLNPSWLQVSLHKQNITNLLTLSHRTNYVFTVCTLHLVLLEWLNQRGCHGWDYAWELKMHTKFWVEIFTQKHHSGDWDIDGIILKLILRKQVMRIWPVLQRFRRGSHGKHGDDYKPLYSITQSFWINRIQVT
jgi:hypothetical protein